MLTIGTNAGSVHRAKDTLTTITSSGIATALLFFIENDIDLTEGTVLEGVAKTDAIEDASWEKFGMFFVFDEELAVGLATD